MSPRLLFLFFSFVFAERCVCFLFLWVSTTASKSTVPWLEHASDSSRPTATPSTSEVTQVSSSMSRMLVPCTCCAILHHHAHACVVLVFESTRPTPCYSSSWRDHPIDTKDRNHRYLCHDPSIRRKENYRYPCRNNIETNERYHRYLCHIQSIRRKEINRYPCHKPSIRTTNHEARRRIARRTRRKSASQKLLLLLLLAVEAERVRGFRATERDASERC